jgi:phosphatidylglycerophosphatase A
MNDKQPENLVSTVMRDPVHLLAFGLGAGLLPIAPGTWGSLFTALVFWFFAPVNLFILLGISSVLFVLGIWICGTSSRRLGVHDHGGIVLDEVVGMLLTLTVV